MKILIEISKISLSLAFILFAGMVTGWLVILGMFMVGIIPTLLTFLVAYGFYAWLVLYKGWFE